MSQELKSKVESTLRKIEAYEWYEKHKQELDRLNRAGSHGTTAW